MAKEPRAATIHSVLAGSQLILIGHAMVLKFALSDGITDPLVFAPLRVLVSVPVMFLTLYVLKEPIQIPKHLWGRLFALGVTGCYFYPVLFIMGVSYTTAANACLMEASIPLFTTAYAVASGRERLSYRKAGGAIIATFGALGMLGAFTSSSVGNDVGRLLEEGVPSQGSLETAEAEIAAAAATKAGMLAAEAEGRNVVFGNLLVLLCSFSYAISLVWQRPVLKLLPPLTVAAWSNLLGGLLILPTSLLYLSFLSLVSPPTPAAANVASGTVELWGGVVRVSPTAWIGVFYAALVTTTIGYFLNGWANAHSSPTLVSVYNTLQPVGAATISWLLLGEAMTGSDMMFSCCVLIGVSLVEGGEGGGGGGGEGGDSNTLGQFTASGTTSRGDSGGGVGGGRGVGVSALKVRRTSRGVGGGGGSIVRWGWLPPHRWGPLWRHPVNGFTSS